MPRFVHDQKNHFEVQGQIQDFKLGGVHLKKLHRAEEGAKNFGVFRVKKHDFTPKNHILSNCGGRHEKCWGISCEKSRFYAKKSYSFQLQREARKMLGYFVWKITILRKKIIFFPILGGACAGCTPPGSAPEVDEKFKMAAISGHSLT